MTSLTRYNQNFLERMDRPYGEDENRYFYDIEGEEPESIELLKYGGEHDSAWSIPCNDNNAFKPSSQASDPFTTNGIR